MKLSECFPKMLVRYVPLHAHGDTKHNDCCDGVISSVNDKYVFVKFDRQLKKFGWEGTTSQSCEAEDLVPLT